MIQEVSDLRVRLSVGRSAIHRTPVDTNWRPIAPTSIGCNLLKSVAARPGLRARTPGRRSISGTDNYTQLARDGSTKNPNLPSQAAFFSVTFANFRLPTCRT